MPRKMRFITLFLFLFVRSPFPEPCLTFILPLVVKASARIAFQTRLFTHIQNSQLSDTEKLLLRGSLFFSVPVAPAVGSGAYDGAGIKVKLIVNVTCALRALSQ